MPQNQNIDFLYSLEKFGIKLGLQNTYSLLNSIGNPQNCFKSIHVAGTNGKGSVSSFITSILRESEYNTGHYTSPHLERFNERIKINNIEIDDQELDYYTKELKNIIIEKKATFFEATTSIAFKYFAEKKVDFGVIETGLGGRFDSTNVLKPLVSVITNISLDHVQQLGPTIESIAFEKAGIIKEGIPCVTASEDKKALMVFEKVCNRLNSILYNVNEIFKIIDYKILPEGLYFSISDNWETYEIYSPVNGFHQIKNIMCAIQTIKILNEVEGTNISKENIADGIKNISVNTGLHCRFEAISKVPLIILDVAHNVESISTLVDTIKLFKKKRVHLIFGIMKDKDYENVINLLSLISDIVYCVKPSTVRALSDDSIAEMFIGKAKQIFKGHSIADSITKALNNLDADDILLITGSHYVCGEAVSCLKDK